MTKRFEYVIDVTSPDGDYQHVIEGTRAATPKSALDKLIALTNKMAREGNGAEGRRMYLYAVLREVPDDS